MSSRIHNFSAGPSALPLPVLEKVKEELLDFKGAGMSLMEMSHRSATYDEVINTAQERCKRLMGVGDDYQVLFMTGGASSQFAFIPMNLCGDKTPVYINTGTWSTKAIKEAQIQGKTPVVAASSEDRNFCYIPKKFEVASDAAYLHITSNNTIKGTQFKEFPKVDVPMIADMSSDIFSKPMDASSFGMIYAGAQKNLGPAGVTVVIIRNDMLERVPADIPTIFKYTTYSEKNSMFNTPPTFPIYVVGLVLEWLEETMGGLEKIAEHNEKKAGMLYDAFEASGGFYKATADVEDRSLMNVTFRLPNEDLEKQFVADALKEGLSGLKGHRSVGGCRASIYNACSMASIEALVGFAKEFAAKNG